MQYRQGSMGRVIISKIEHGDDLLSEIGTVFCDSNGPQIHLHASLGRGEESLTGCIRKDSKVYLVVELILLEIIDSSGIRTLDELTGLKLLGFAE